MCVTHHSLLCFPILRVFCIGRTNTKVLRCKTESGTCKIKVEEKNNREEKQKTVSAVSNNKLANEPIVSHGTMIILIVSSGILVGWLEAGFSEWVRITNTRSSIDSLGLLPFCGESAITIPLG